MAKHERLFDKGDPLSSVANEPKSFGAGGYTNGQKASKPWVDRRLEKNDRASERKGR